MNLEISLTWRSREEFKRLFECKSLAKAKTYFEFLLASVLESVEKELIKIAELFRNHFDRVCNALFHKQYIANAERINGKIQEIKPLVEDTGRTKISELPFCSSSEVWIFVPSFRDRTIFSNEQTPYFV